MIHFVKCEFCKIISFHCDFVFNCLQEKKTIFPTKEEIKREKERSRVSDPQSSSSKLIKLGGNKNRDNKIIEVIKTNTIIAVFSCRFGTLRTAKKVTMAGGRKSLKKKKISHSLSCHKKKNKKKILCWREVKTDDSRCPPKHSVGNNQESKAVDKKKGCVILVKNTKKKNKNKSGE